MITEIIKQFTGSEHSLRRKTIAGGNWLMIKSLIIAVLDLIRAAIFARILSPNDYGLMALIMTGIGLCDAFSVTGIEIMVQRDNDHYRQKLSSYWTIKLSRGIILTVLTWFFAAPVAAFYGKPEIIPVMRFLGLSFLFKGLSSFGKEIRQRDMQFSKIALVEICAGMLILSAGIAVLFTVSNVWALAAYAVMSSFAIMIVSYVLHPWRPQLGIDWPIFKEVMFFSGSLMLMNIFNYLFTSIDIVIVGKLLGTENVGYYARSNFLALLPATYFASAISPVLLPAFRKLADDNARFRRAFAKVLLVFTIVFFVMGILLFTFSKFIVLAVYGPKWLPILPVFNILILYGVSKSILMITPAVYYLKGKQWFMTLCGAITTVALPFLCLPLTARIGLTGTAWAVVIVACISHIGLIIYAFKLLCQGPDNTSIKSPQKEDIIQADLIGEDRTTMA